MTDSLTEFKKLLPMNKETYAVLSSSAGFHGFYLAQMPGGPGVLCDSSTKIIYYFLSDTPSECLQELNALSKK
jgi:hypothetical protein